MQIKVVNLKGKETGSIDLNPEIFSIEPKLGVISEVVRWHLAVRQAGTHQVKSRSMVHGTTKKAFKQKGTGRARRGSWTSNICRGGGIVFGPVVRSHAFKLNKKVRQLALKSLLSLRLKEGNFVVLDDLEKISPKTKEINNDLKGLGINSALFVLGEGMFGGFLNAIANLPGMDTISIRGLNVYDAIKKEKLVLTKEALQNLQIRYEGGKDN